MIDIILVNLEDARRIHKSLHLAAIYLAEKGAPADERKEADQIKQEFERSMCRRFGLRKREDLGSYAFIRSVQG